MDLAVNRFGTTKPCTKISELACVPIELVDACMEFQLWVTGIRNASRYLDSKFGKAGMEVARLQNKYALSERTVESIMSDCYLVCVDMRNQAEAERGRAYNS